MASTSTSAAAGTKEMIDQNATRLRLRALFPAFTNPESATQGWIYFNNAGGSVAPQAVIDAIGSYLARVSPLPPDRTNFSSLPMAVVAEAHHFMETYMGGAGLGRCVVGASSSALLAMLTRCYADLLGEGDEIVLSMAAHEANVGPWERTAAKVGAKVVWWESDGAAHVTATVDTLRPLLNERTRIVAIPHVSNVYGEIVDVAAMCAAVKELAPNARTVVDGVAYAPHRCVDVAAFGCDWYVMSNYKTFGPHVATLWGREEELLTLPGDNHYWVPNAEVPYKFQLGWVNNEACAGLLGFRSYLNQVLDRDPDAEVERSDVVAALDVITELEAELAAAVVAVFDRFADRVTLIGPKVADPGIRVPTFAFGVNGVPSKVVAAHLQESAIVCRSGHMSVKRSIFEVEGSDENGVARISLDHYNTLDEVAAFEVSLEALLASTAAETTD